DGRGRRERRPGAGESGRRDRDGDRDGRGGRVGRGGPGGGRPAGDCEGPRPEPGDPGEHPPEPVPGVRLQRRWGPGRRRRPGHPDPGERRHEPEFAVGGWERPATAARPAVTARPVRIEDGKRAARSTQRKTRSEEKNSDRITG